MRTTRNETNDRHDIHQRANRRPGGRTSGPTGDNRAAGEPTRASARNHQVARIGDDDRRGRFDRCPERQSPISLAGLGIVGLAGLGATSASASNPFELTLLDTGLDEGETVTAEDVDLEADVDADGAVRFELGADERTISLAVEESSGGIGLPPPPPPAEPAAFEFGEATLSATSLELGETFSVEVPVANVGDELGSETVSLLVEGERVDEAAVTLTGGSEETVELRHSFEAGGEFEVAIPDVLTESVSVVDPDPSDDTAPADDAEDDSAADPGDASTAAETDEPNGGISGFVAALVIGCVLAIAALVFHRTRA